MKNPARIYALSLLVIIGQQAIAASMVRADDKDDYYDCLDKRYANCWPASRIPIKVYFNPKNSTADFLSKFLPVFRSACDEWAKASEGKVSFEFVYVEPLAGITVKFLTVQSNETEGEATADGDREGICKSVITIDQKQNAASFDEEKMKALCLHELGHALGIQGHSPNAKDMLHELVHLEADTKASDVHVSTRDKNTLLKLIAIGPVANKEYVKWQDDLDKVKIHNLGVDQLKKKDFEGAQNSFNKALAMDSSYQSALENLTVLYWNWTIVYYEKGDFSKAAELLRKDRDCLRKLKTPNKPELLKVLQTLSTCLQQENKTEELKANELEIKALGN